MAQIEIALKNKTQERWKQMNEQLCRFVGSRAIRDQQLEEPTSLSRTDQQQRRKEQVEEMHDLALRHGHDPSKAGNISLPENRLNTGAESKRLLNAELETSERIVKEDEAHQARGITAHAKKDSQRSNSRGETTYRKMFRGAAECLREALQLDGVLFNDGLTGQHGGVQPIPEGENELEHEMVQRPRRERFPEETIGHDPFFPKDGSSSSDTPLHQQSREARLQPTTMTYKSTEYRSGVNTKRHAEILGLSIRGPDGAPKSKPLSKTTLGLVQLEEGHLQMLMNRYPEGNVWYIHHDTDVCYSLRNDVLVEEEPLQETKNLISTFPGARQIIFQPLKDPVSEKRLAGCFAWSMTMSPAFTDTTDLPSLRGFLHVLESEVSRIDMAAALKQQEAFVSSVSHELRTPLHGILGSVQLLADTDLNSFQKDLANTIKTSGTTLNETLTSVLSYARINQFERQQHKYRQKRPPDSVWSHSAKLDPPPGADTIFKGLYVSANIALLCEEITSVLDAGQSYDSSTETRNITVINEIDYEENWNYFTEPGALRRIAMNIIGNALKYTTNGSVTFKLTVSDIELGDAAQQGDRVPQRMITLAVKDTGKGISKEFMENHLFVPFTQEDTTSSQGVGLGMSIVKSLVSLLAGVIEVESELGRGTEVTIKIPMTLCNPEQEAIGKPAFDLSQRNAFVRGEHLSVVLFGFPTVIRHSLERCLHESNEDVVDDVEKMAQRCSKPIALLSAALNKCSLANPMRTFKGYSRVEQLHHPTGPDSLGKALSGCMVQLQDIRGHGDGSEESASVPGETALGNADRQLRDENQTLDESACNASRKRAQTSSARSDSANGQDTSLPESEDAQHRHEGDPYQRVPPSRCKSSTGSEDSSNVPMRLRILVVEDNAVNRKLLGAFLKKHGCQNVQYAENGALAVKMVEERPESFDVIFMDLSMPVMDGFTATREIRRMEQERSSASPCGATTTPAYIAALTGLASEQDEDEAFAAGVNKFVTKPIQFNKLLEILEQ
ncbi:hypothetical protein EKO04_009812 [Ascochyta lentis]|uniref:Uncharacterized protein n=1 Tax=Ascochyta lentis TaxID=205686 RepID=A0A8H7MG43_9PLEO|nr:hypothetical protein EKO04_009812 [Ascochyta lentis]